MWHCKVWQGWLAKILDSFVQVWLTSCRDSHCVLTMCTYMCIVCTTLNNVHVSMSLYFVFGNGVQVVQSVVWKEAWGAAADWFTRGGQVDLYPVHQIPQGPVLSWHCQKEKVNANFYSLSYKKFLWHVENLVFFYSFKSNRFLLY